MTAPQTKQFISRRKDHRKGDPCFPEAAVQARDRRTVPLSQKTESGKMQEIGEEAYNKEQAEKRRILDRLLAEYNDGRKKTLFCLAVNLLPLEVLRTVFEDGDLDLPLQDRAKQMEKRLKEKSSLELKLRRKKGNPIDIPKSIPKGLPRYCA